MDLEEKIVKPRSRSSSQKKRSRSRDNENDYSHKDEGGDDSSSYANKGASSQSGKKRRPSHSRSRSRNSRQNSQHDSFEEGKREDESIKFPIDFYVDEEISEYFLKNDQKILNSVKSESNLQILEINNRIQIPELSGKIFTINDEDRKKKCEAFCNILKEISQFSKDVKKHRDQKISIIILVPEGMVSLLIGSKGRQINTIMKESKTEIVVNQPIHKMKHRTVKIDGKPGNIARSTELIFKILEERAHQVTDIEKEPVTIDLKHIKITAKFVFSKNVVGYLIGKHGSFTKSLSEKCEVSIKFEDESKIRCVRKGESNITGKLESVQNAVCLLLRRVNDFFTDYKQSQEEFTIKLLIPNIYVTKLLGAKGCMIRELAAKAGKAQIKILSDKNSEREIQECIVSIAGNLANKQDASCMILEQIEIFKNGGPILISGKSINDNLAGQYRNSVQNKFSSDASQIENKSRKLSDELGSYSKKEQSSRAADLDDIRKTYKKKSFSPKKSKSRSRSRSRSRSKSPQRKAKRISKSRSVEKERKDARREKKNRDNSGQDEIQSKNEEKSESKRISSTLSDGKRSKGKSENFIVLALFNDGRKASFSPDQLCTVQEISNKYNVEICKFLSSNKIKEEIQRDLKTSNILKIKGGTGNVLTALNKLQDIVFGDILD